jgi:membrane-associated phospholipid phosphatase
MPLPRLTALAQRRLSLWRERYPARIGWLEARLSPEGAFGLHLTLGALALIVMAWVFGEIAEDIVEGDPIVLLDHQIAGWFRQHATAAFIQVMHTVTYFGSARWIVPVTIAAVAVMLWKRTWYRAILTLLVVPCGGLLNLLLKAAFQRQRPILEHPLVALQSFSFPSGHTMGATLLYGLAAVLAFHWVRTWRGRIYVVAAASACILLVGFSRIALRAHFLSDVLAAIAAGLAWLAICVTAVETLRRRVKTER